MKKKTVLVIMVIVLLLLTIILVTFNKKEPEKKENQNKKSTPAVNEWYKPEGTSNEIDIYYYQGQNNYLSVFKNDDKSFIDNLYEYKNTYKCNITDCKVYSFSDDKVVIKDDKYILYNFVNNKAKKLSLPYAEYNDIRLLASNGKTYGLAVSNINNMYAFYSIKDKRFTTDFKYSNIFYKETDGLSKGYISTVINDNDNIKYYVINYNNDNIIHESDTYIGIVGNENYVYFYNNFSDLAEIDAFIYNEDFKPLFDKNYNMFSITKLGNVIIKNNDDTFSMYNKNGNLVKTSKEYKKILYMVNDYIIVIDKDDYLKIVDYDGNVKVKFDKLYDYEFDDSISGMYFSDKKSVIYIYINILSNDENQAIKYYYVPESMGKGKLNL